MRKLNALLLALVLCVVIAGIYGFARKDGWLSDSNAETTNTPAPSQSTGQQTADGNAGSSETPTPTESAAAAPPASPSPSSTPEPEESPSPDPTTAASQDQYSNGEDGAIAVIAHPASVTALVNPYNKLPDDYKPDNLVYPDVAFIFSEKLEKRMMRQEAADALEQLFSGAEEDGIYLAGVSAYRSHATQTALFNRYVERDGYEKARTYSALPGTSEHESGLAIDVTSSDGKCAAADCFGDTKEAAWLKEHAGEYGFIIRYPDGKDKITGYQYEPWHIRYVGTELSGELAASGKTLEEYYDAVPVSR
ncbi:M15 family metallopeptidase [Paenibacillus sp. HB172176]|uniref:M15 family metallopeptidase n=1 Tax=Paenibacillus sp. HB172176 TaxID=2493690 RepID=UPI00143C6BF0|nr:M15 family metallopeptidase [Paenibacillus sp. HB172176]